MRFLLSLPHVSVYHKLVGGYVLSASDLTTSNKKSTLPQWEGAF